MCAGTTGHAEVVRVTFDPQVISFEEILEVFFTVHDPTTLNRQGGDVGPQYRSVVFYRGDGQRATVERVIGEMEAAQIWDKRFVTEVTAFERFWPAEAYHQEYYRRNSGQSYCQVVIAPKVTKFRTQYLEKLKER